MAKQNLEYYIKIIPPGNQKDFPLICEQLIKRNVCFGSRVLRAGGGICRIPSTEIHKLPKDENGPYLPVTDDRRYSIHIDDIDKNNLIWEGFE